MANECLPFPRGQTASNGISIPGANGLASTLPTTTGLFTEATPYRVDLANLRPVETLSHNLTNSATVGATGAIKTPADVSKLKLRCLQASADITVSKHGLLIAFDTGTAQHWGVVAEAVYAAGDGVVCKPIDNAYPIGYVISKYDWFYVVEEGDCYVAVTSGSTLTVGSGVASGGSGLAVTAAAGDPVCGTASETVTGDGTVATDICIIHVNEGVQDSAAA
jgi:hypothetical protein